jgi:hypothetical protein
MSPNTTPRAPMIKPIPAPFDDTARSGPVPAPDARAPALVIRPVIRYFHRLSITVAITLASLVLGCPLRRDDAPPHLVVAHGRGEGLVHGRDRNGGSDVDGASVLNRIGQQPAGRRPLCAGWLLAHGPFRSIPPTGVMPFLDARPAARLGGVGRAGGDAGRQGDHRAGRRARHR